jgi:hypothetical protein
MKTTILKYIFTFTLLYVSASAYTLKLESNTTTLNVGEKASLTLIETYSDNSTKVLEDNVTYIINPSQNAKVNGSVLTALKDGNVTVQAKVGTTLSNTLNLNITWVVNGHVLPPEPDPAVNNATLLGVDVNSNGVRDDVERWIYETYNEYIPCHQELDGEETLPSGQVIQFGKEVCEDNPVPYHPVVRAVAMQGARAAQIIIQEPEKARETLKIWDAALFCSFGVRDFNVYNKISPLNKEFDNVQFNTIQRSRSYAKFNFNLSGGVYDSPSHRVMLIECNEEVHKLLEDLK